MKNFKVTLTTNFEFDVKSDSMDNAAEEAMIFFESMKHTWGSGPHVIWHDRYVVKKLVEEEHNS